MRKVLKFYLHTFAFTLFPVVFLWAHNRDEVTFSDVWVTLFILFFSIVVFIFFLRKIIDDDVVTGMIGSLFVLSFFSYGQFFQMFLLKLPKTGIWFFTRHRFFLPIWCGVTVGLGYWILKKRKMLEKFVPFLNAVSLFLVILSVFQITVYEFKRIKGKEVFSKESLEFKGKLCSRDIYYIILDGHAGFETLKDLYNYDFRKSEFIRELKKMGFFIPKVSFSNYSGTLLSLPSSLNMEYLRFVGKGDKRMLKQNIGKNKVMEFLKARGYKIYSLGLFGSKKSDFYYRGGLFNVFQSMLLQTSLLKPFEPFFISLDIRKRTLNILKKLKEIPNVKEKKFVFVHLDPPHPPYVFDEKGKRPRFSITSNTTLNTSSKFDYFNQLKFIDKQILKLIKFLIKESKIAPIIVIQSDHGPEPCWYNKNRKSINYGEKLSKKEIVQRLENLNVCYLPDGGEKLLFGVDIISPVNTFRVIFNYYFGMDYKILQYKGYLHHLTLGRFAFEDVTDFITKEGELEK